MKHLIDVSVPMVTNNDAIQVKFSKIGNEHLYSDTFERCKTIRKEYLARIDEILEGASYKNFAYNEKTRSMAILMKW